MTAIIEGIEGGFSKGSSVLSSLHSITSIFQRVTAWLCWLGGGLLLSTVVATRLLQESTGSYEHLTPTNSEKPWAQKERTIRGKPCALAKSLD
ncbi:MAG: hypothetical protein P8N49_02150 [Opitutales bacterium]|nr:hypothetical protein [Opitutales bacterium]